MVTLITSYCMWFHFQVKFMWWNMWLHRTVCHEETGWDLNCLLCASSSFHSALFILSRRLRWMVQDRKHYFPSNCFVFLSENALSWRSHWMALLQHTSGSKYQAAGEGWIRRLLGSSNASSLSFPACNCASTILGTWNQADSTWGFFFLRILVLNLKVVFLDDYSYF